MTTADILEIWIEDAEKERKIVALVEGLQKDESFWQDMFDEYTKRQVSLDFPFAEKGGQTGKDALIPYYSLLTQFVGRFMICRDSDNEHLYDNEAEILFQTPYLFHTHSYNIENHKCVPLNLNKICKEITSKEHDFHVFINKYSEITYRFLIIFLWLREEASLLTKNIKTKRANGEDVSVEITQLSIWNQLCKESEIRAILKYDAAINHISKISDYWKSIEQRIVEYEKKVKNELVSQHFFTDIAAVDSKLAICEAKYAAIISPLETYHYLNGHILLDDVIQPLFKQVKDDLIRKRFSELTKQIQAEYRNKAQEVNIPTRLDISYKECLRLPSPCDFVQKIGNDIQVLYGTLV